MYTAKAREIRGQREACQTDFLHFVVVRKSEFAEEVEAEECEDHDPERYEHLAVEDTPSVSKGRRRRGT